MTTEQRLEAIERNLCEINELLRHKPGDNPVLERQQIETDPKSIDMPALKPLIRDWEVLEFKSVGKWDGEEGVIYSRSEDGLYGTCTLFSQDNMLYGQNGSVKDGRWSIHSVRRTTDGQVFTVGDRIKEGVIDLFSIEGNRMDVWTEPGNEIKFQFIGHVKKSEPIYTSADGVAIFEGDTVYEYSNSVIMKTHFAVGKTYSGPLYSSREAAMKAKPLFTTVDGVDIYSDETLVYCFTSVGSVNEWPYGKTQKDYSRGFFSTRTAAETAYKNWLYDQPVLKLSDFSGNNFAPLEELVKSRLV